jgi:enoyl-CoA hydratase
MTVTVETHGEIALVLMDDGKANAVSEGFLDALEPALSEAAKSKAAVLVGRPGRFSGGFDLKAMQHATDEERQRLVTRGGRMIHSLYSFPKPLVGAITGHAVALGALMALGCDTRVGTEGAFLIGLNETAIGLTLPTFGLEMAKARLGPEYLTAAVIQAQLYNPDEATNAGFLDETADADHLIDRAIEIATRLSELPSGAHTATKLALRSDILDRIDASLRD